MYHLFFGLTSPSTYYLSGVLEKTYPAIFEITISNKTEEPIKVPWDSVAYVDEKGVSNKVIKSGTRLIDRNRVFGDEIIPPNARIEEILQPVDAIYYLKGKGGGWQSMPVLDNLSIGEKITVFVPVEVAGSLKNYSFTFEAARYDSNETLAPSTINEIDDSCEYGYTLMLIPETGKIECVHYNEMQCKTGYKLFFQRGHWECVKE